MRFTCNITFIINPEIEAIFLDYVRKELFPLLFSKESPAHNPELRKVVEVGGEKPDPEHGLSIALAAKFDTKENAKIWNEDILLPSLHDFNLKFGNHSLFFITLLETLPIN